MAEIENSINNMNCKIENTIMKCHDLGMCLDVIDFGLEEMHFQSSSIPKCDHLALSVNIPPQELTSEFDYIYNQCTTLSLKGKLSLEIYLNSITRFMSETIQKEIQDKDAEINGSKIQHLKDILWYTELQRKEYFPLIKSLPQDLILYKWLFSGGLSSTGSVEPAIEPTLNCRSKEV